MPNPVLVEDVRSCQLAAADLLKASEVAVDLEGVALGRHPGKICILQAVGDHHPDTVYLFDISVLASEAFEEGRLGDLFESTVVRKVFWDVRADTDALYHNHDVKVQNAYDLQLLYHLKFNPQAPYVPALRTAFAHFGKTQLSAETMLELNAIKEKGLRLFAPDHGGTFAVFEERPLSNELVEYCAADVKYLLDMRAFWGTAALDAMVLVITSDRMMDFISQPCIDEEVKKRVDFRVPADLQAELPPGEEEEIVQIPRGKVGLVIGKGGATIKRIQASSGANISIDDVKCIARVRGTPEEVERAQGLITDVVKFKS